MRLAAAALGLLACRSGSTTLPEARADEGTAPPVAVVELFTSEGCSSCPPADAVLEDLARSGAGPVYALAFHVDYWDGLGWPDPFASPQYTDRQQTYASVLPGSGLYTLQMVVGGTEQFVGSDRDRVRAAVGRALAHKASVRLAVRARLARPGVVIVDYEAVGALAGAELEVALLQHAASVAVRAGENAGRTLHHTNVVRGLTTVRLASATGSVSVRLRHLHRLPDTRPCGGLHPQRGDLLLDHCERRVDGR